MSLHTESQHPNTINPQRFGQKYVSKAKHPTMLRIYRDIVASDIKTVIKSVVAELLSVLLARPLDSDFKRRFVTRKLASIVASTSVQSIAADKENIDSDSDDEPVQHGVNKLHYSSKYSG
ncbi:hypothetical protein L1987_85444 [Smallanthus sonchifolius]|uniref:Uncharacterized protein n=1 Tax=Smallanthus sonchifolius TaxID=185202 RepID=A0ACB8XWJ4_9ASTR|nr:hypothetical protein L1987_85444 [Smallanthus sonchifolius]